MSSSPSSLGATRTAAIAAGAVAAFLLFIVVPGVLLYRRLRYQKGFQKCGTGGVAEDGGATGERPLDPATLHSSSRHHGVQKRIQQLFLARGGPVRAGRSTWRTIPRKGRITMVRCEAVLPDEAALISEHAEESGAFVGAYVPLHK